MIETVIHNEETLAIIVRAKHRCEGINFFTPDSYPLQLAYMNRPEGYRIQPHIHRPIERHTLQTQEVLFIKSGILRVDFYDSKENYLSSRILSEGDVVLLATGGHGFEALEAVEIIEVKQGPYSPEMDKIRFKTVDSRNLKIERNRE